MRSTGRPVVRLLPVARTRHRDFFLTLGVWFALSTQEKWGWYPRVTHHVASCGRFFPRRHVFRFVQVGACAGAPFLFMAA